MSNQNAEVTQFLEAWSLAELSGDTIAVADALADDFAGIGPLGFILPKKAWLDRYASGALKYESFGLGEVQIRSFGDVAVVTARQNSVGAYSGNPVPEALRASLVLSRDSSRWQLALSHLSFVAGAAGSPPLPGRP